MGTLALAVGPHVAVALLLAAGAGGAQPPPPARAPEPLAPVAPRRRVAAVRTALAPRIEPARTLAMRLERGEWAPSDRPNTWVHIPATRDRAPDLRLTFVFHGFKNCIASYTSSGASCSRGELAIRPGYAVAEQLEREGSSSIVVIPETSYDVDSAEAPFLSLHGRFRAYVEELLEALAEETGGAHLSDVRRLALVASSGGYQALEPILDDAGPLVTDVLLLDAGYMYPNSTTGRFLGVVAAELDEGVSRHRLGILYTPSGGALPTSLALRNLARAAVGDRGRFGHFRDDPPADALRAPLYVLRVDEDHDVVVRRNLGRVLAAAGL